MDMGTVTWGNLTATIANFIALFFFFQKFATKNELEKLRSENKDEVQQLKNNQDKIEQTLNAKLEKMNIDINALRMLLVEMKSTMEYSTGYLRELTASLNKLDEHLTDSNNRLTSLEAEHKLRRSTDNACRN